MNISSQVRADAARCLNQVIDNYRTIDWLEAKHPKRLKEPIVREMLYGTLRYLPGLKRLCDPLLDKPMRSKDSDIYALLLVGAYQLKFMQIPDHAAINETVAACRTLNKPWATRLVNAILRNVSRTLNSSDTEHSFEAKQQFEPELRRQINAQYEANAHALFEALLTQAPMVLRINTAKIGTKDYTRLLEENGVPYAPGGFPECIILDTPRPADKLPGFKDGWVAVQDGGAQWAYHILFDTFSSAPTNADILQSYNCKLLDVCAAPGGKLFHTMEQHLSPLHVTALELEPRRADTMVEIGERLSHNITPLIGDASQSDWWDGEMFTHILLDAPCSGTGTIRRHPDIKALFRSDQLHEQQATQLAILNNVWPMLKPGGSLLYCTCSLLEQENDLVIEAFVNQQEGKHSPSFHIQTLDLPTGQVTRHGWQLLPTDRNTDGFYFALLRKPLKPSAP